MKKNDWVIDRSKNIGLVVSLSRDKTLADVQWKNRGLRIVTRTSCRDLTVITTIPINFDTFKN